MPPTPQQRLWQERIEALLGLAAPLLDAVLVTGERVSRLIAPEDQDYYPVAAPEAAAEIEPGRRPGPPPGTED